MRKDGQSIYWEDPELEDWEYEDGFRSEEERCWPAVAVVVAFGAAFCRPRRCYPDYWCYPRPCRPL